MSRPRYVRGRRTCSPTARVTGRPAASNASATSSLVTDPTSSTIYPVDLQLPPTGRVHGVVVRKGQRSGLLLPQVAPEWGWDVATLLEQVCLKAGLPGDAWRAGNPPASLYRFSAEVFGESA